MAELETLIEKHEVYDAGGRRYFEVLYRDGMLNEENAAKLLEALDAANLASSEEQEKLDKELDREALGHPGEPSKRTTGREDLPRRVARGGEERRLLILARHVARVAAQDPDVRRFRQDCFGSPEGCVSWGRAGELLRQVAGGGGGARLMNLVRVARVIGRLYDWTESQAARFLLTGWAPVPEMVRTSISVNLAAGPRATITVRAQPFATREAVAEAFAEVQRERLGQRIKRPIGQNLDLFDYVGSRIAELRRPLTKDDWRDLWKACPNRKLRRDSPTRMRQNYEVTKRRLLPDSYLRAVIPTGRRRATSTAPAPARTRRSRR